MSARCRPASPPSPNGPLFALDAAVTRETIVALADLKARLAAYEYAVLAHAEQVKVGSETGCTSTAVWAANATRTRKNVVAGQVRLATSLESRWHRVRTPSPRVR